MRTASRKRPGIWIAAALALGMLTLALRSLPTRLGSTGGRVHTANGTERDPLERPQAEGIQTDRITSHPPSPISILEPTPEPSPSRLPPWLRDAIDLEEAPDGAIFTNFDSTAPPSLNPRHLAVLQDIIDLNRLDESSAARDHDDQDGTLEPLELGYQLWVGGQLVALSLGADPYSSFGYGIESLPASIGDLDRLQLLDVQSNRLLELPFEIGTLAELRELRAQRNQLFQLPDSFGLLSQLRGAHFSQNDLTEIPESIGDLVRLEWLYVSDNPLSGLPNSLGNLQNLRALGLQNTGSDPSRPELAGAGDEFDGLAALPGALESLPALDALYVTGNHLGCVDSRTILRLATGTDSRVFGLSAQRCSP